MSTTCTLPPTITPTPGPSRQSTEDVLTALVVALTGLPENLVRPRYQPDPPKAPKPDVNWCAVGIARRSAPPVSEVRRVRLPGGSEVSRVETHETLEVLASFYGPQSDEMALALREGLQVESNRYPLREANMAYVQCGELAHVPELVNLKFLYRVDVPLTLRRGPALPERNKPVEGTVDVPPIETVPLCCGKMTSR